MPHQCTTCGKVFPDGSKQMLSGCPSCGGNKFQFQPATTKRAGESDASAASDASGTGTRDLTSSAADAVRQRSAQTTDRPDEVDADMTVSDWVDNQRTPEPEPTGTAAADSPSTDSTSTPEDGSVAPEDGTAAPEGGTTVPEDGTAAPDEGRTATDAGHSTSSEQTREWGEWPSKPGEDGESRSSHPDSQQSPQADGQQSPQRQSNPSDRPIRARIEEDEDNSQKSARSDVVSPEELAAYRETDVEPSPSASQTPSEAPTPESHPARENPAAESPQPTADDGTVIEPSSDERPSLDQLREELNDQFESIKILGPGQYELNLMELYDRDEYIISLKEDGRYVIEVPDTWGRGDRDD